MPELDGFVYEGTLQQITPLIHFQPESEKPCLRSTTVKPRLDAYVLHFLKKKGINEDQVPKQWKEVLGPNEQRRTVSLRYKLFFWVNNPVTGNDRIHRLYFGNMNKNNIKKACEYREDNPIHFRMVSLASDTITVDNQSYTLLQLLRLLFSPFMDLHCFGTRATKGFGSFIVNNGERNRWQTLNPDLLPPECLAAFRVTKSFDCNILDAVYVLLACMKGGFNTNAAGKPNHPPHTYVKGYIQKRERDQGWGTEKRFIKQEVFQSEQREKYNVLVSVDHQLSKNLPKPEKSYRFSRAMLGLTDTYRFGVGIQSFSLTVKNENGIERFPNPIRFKPIGGNELLILVYKIPDMMYDQEFKIEGHSIKTPDAFDPVEFTEESLKWITTHPNNSPDFDIDENNPPFRNLLKIIQSLRISEPIKAPI